jgi:uncharacterized membrane protein YphA (DoxX/SURF4 family)
MFDKKVLNIYCYITGLFFIISGVGKVLDTAAFGNLIFEYGFGQLMVLAPLIAVAEIAIGFCLLLLFKPAFYSLAASGLLTLFTLAFAYAHIQNGVNDCGCFGTLKQVNIPPFFSFARNAVLLALSLAVYIKYPRNENPSGKWKKYIMLPVLCISMFIAGFTYNTPFFLIPRPEQHRFQDQLITNTPLAKYIKTSPDSTYLLFCFSYSCSHCWNSIENFRNYKKGKMVDSIISLATGDNDAKYFFDQNFHPDFYVRDLSAGEMGEITEVYPVAFYIRHDSVKIIIPSELPSPVTFKREYFLASTIYN